MEIQRNGYLEQLILRKDNGMIKVITCQVFAGVENRFYSLLYLRGTCLKMVLMRIISLKLL